MKPLGDLRFLNCLILAGCGMALGLAGCQPAAPQSAAPPPPPVTVAKPIEREIVEWDEYTGRTDAIESVDIRPRVSGYINQVAFKAGDIVKKGALLFLIDPRPYQAVLDQDKANLKNAEAARDLARANFERAQKLFQTRVSSKEEFDTQTSQRNQAEAQYLQSEASLASAQLNIEFTQVRSPIDGRISRELVTAGNLVTADNTLLTTVNSVDPVYAYFNVDERQVQKYVNQIKAGERLDSRTNQTPIYLQLQEEKGFPHEGFIDFINNTYNSSTGTLQVRGRFRNEDGFLLAGAFVRIRVAGTPKFNGILITDRAIGTDQGQKFAMVVDQENKVQVRPLELGSVVNGLRVVRKGLNPDEEVIINGLVNARPGGQVQPQPGKMDQFVVNQSVMAVSTNKEESGQNKKDK